MTNEEVLAVLEAGLLAAKEGLKAGCGEYVTLPQCIRLKRSKGLFPNSIQEARLRASIRGTRYHIMFLEREIRKVKLNAAIDEEIRAQKAEENNDDTK